MLQTCSTHVQDTSDTRPNYMSNTWPTYVQHMSNTWAQHVQSISNACSNMSNASDEPPPLRCQRWTTASQMPAIRLLSGAGGRPGQVGRQNLTHLFMEIHPKIVCPSLGRGGGGKERVDNFQRIWRWKPFQKLSAPLFVYWNIFGVFLQYCWCLFVTILLYFL